MEHIVGFCSMSQTRNSFFLLISELIYSHLLRQLNIALASVILYCSYCVYYICTFPFSMVCFFLLINFTFFISYLVFFFYFGPITLIKLLFKSVLSCNIVFVCDFFFLCYFCGQSILVSLLPLFWSVLLLVFEFQFKIFVFVFLIPKQGYLIQFGFLFSFLLLHVFWGVGVGGCVGDFHQLIVLLFCFFCSSV